MDPRRKELFQLFLHEFFWRCVFIICICIIAHETPQLPSTKRKRYSIIRKQKKQAKYLQRLTMRSDVKTKFNLRFTMSAFGKLCNLLRNVGGLKDTKYVPHNEQVAIFLAVLAHHKKNRIIGFDYRRSGDTMSKCFHRVLNCLLKLHHILLSQPEPIQNDEESDRWRFFPGCIGALDGTYVKVQVPLVDKPRYRSRKGEIATNVLVACDITGKFTYALAGWEGSAADGRVLRDAIHRPNGLRVPIGSYYLCDNGYTNGEGFLTPYRGVRYHLKEWGVGNEAPQDHSEYFNMRHSQARNVIERCFGQVKKRWGILRSNAFYPIKIQNRIIMACLLIHNFQRMTMPNDMSDSDLSSDSDSEDENGGGNNSEYVEVVASSHAWTAYRDEMAHTMYDEWLAGN